jgi:hypothetical protein
MSRLVYDRSTLDVEYGDVAIFDGLTDQDRRRWGLSESLEQFLSGAGVKSLRARCGNRLGALAAFKKIRELAEAGEFYSIHIVAHGSKTGLRFGTSERLRWPDLGVALSPINRAEKGQLVLNMTSCFGIHAVKSADFTPTGDPFFGVLGVNHKLGFREALVMNCVIYHQWLRGRPLNEIVRSVNALAKHDILYCSSAEGYRKLRSGALP